MRARRCGRWLQTGVVAARGDPRAEARTPGPAVCSRSRGPVMGAHGGPFPSFSRHVLFLMDLRRLVSAFSVRAPSVSDGGAWRSVRTRRCGPSALRLAPASCHHASYLGRHLQSIAEICPYVFCSLARKAAYAPAACARSHAASEGRSHASPRTPRPGRQSVIIPRRPQPIMSARIVSLVAGCCCGPGGWSARCTAAAGRA
jgi:hypothetical protein